MGVGALISSCAIAKAIVLKELFEVDYTWSIYKPAICTIIEHLLGIIIASVPALKPIYSKFVAMIKSSQYLSKRRFGKFNSPNGSFPFYSSSKVDSAKVKGQTPSPDHTAIMKKTEFYLSVNQYIEMELQKTSAPVWPMPGFPTPSPGAMDHSRTSMC